MKKQNHKPTKLWTLLFLVFTIFISCEQETHINEQSLETNAQQKNSIETLTLDKLSLDRNFNDAIKNFGLKNILENGNGTFLKKSTTTEISVDTENIIEIKKKNYTSYTFRVIDQNNGKEVLENLVIEQRHDTLQGFLIKYRYSQNYLDQLEKGVEIPFEGTVQRTHYNENIEELFNKINDSKSSNKENTLTKSSSYICATSTLVGEKRCASKKKHRVGEQCSLTGSNRAHYYTYTVTNCWYEQPNIGWSNVQETVDYIEADEFGGGGGTTTTTNTPPCDNCNGNYLAKEISTKLGLFFAEEQQWLENLGEDPFVEDLYLFLDSDNSLKATLFGKEAFKAKKEGGEVDFENKIIKDKSFIGTNADCVLKALMSSGNNLFKKTSEAFTGDKSEYRIKFTTYNKPSDNAIARTALPDDNNIIEIRFNLPKINQPSIDMAGSIFHETIHAELHRIKFSNNAGPNPLPVAQYNWYMKLWKLHEGIFDDNINKVATYSEHTYMANYFINPIASGLRAFDEKTHPVENYKFIAWTGLEDFGINAEYITTEELSRLANLSNTIRTDSHINPCD